MRRDNGIDTLLDLHDQVIDQGSGYWIKIEAWQVFISEEIPHGVRYSLTLHEPYGKRILGYDNAHGISYLKNSNMLENGIPLITNTGMSVIRVFPMNFRAPINCWQISLLKLIVSCNR